MHTIHQPTPFGRRGYNLLFAAVLIVLIAALFSSQVVANAAQQADCDASMDYMAWGEDGLGSGDYAAAAAAYACAIEIDPENYAAYFWRGALAGANADYNQLGNDLYTFYTHRTGSEDAMRLSIIKTMPTLNEAAQARPDDATVYLLRGLVFTVADLGAEVDFEKLIELAPENGIGYLFYWLNTNPVASADVEDEHYLKGAELAADSVLLDWVRSFSVIDITESVAEDNLVHFDPVIEAHPDHLFAFAARGMAHILVGDSSSAASDYYQHIQNNQVEVVEETALDLGTESAFQAAAGTVYRIPFTATAGQVLNITAVREDSGIFFVFPLTYVVLNPAGEVLPGPYRIQVAMGGTVTPISKLEIPADGTYTLVLTPNYSGMVELAVWED